MALCRTVYGIAQTDLKGVATDPSPRGRSVFDELLADIEKHTDKHGHVHLMAFVNAVKVKSFFMDHDHHHYKK